MTQNADTIFTQNWNIYQKVVGQNYMLHREFGSVLGSILKRFEKKMSFAVLDLGCGDAKLMAEQLQPYNEFFYKGFDLSDAALAVAAAYTRDLQGIISFVNGPMEELIDYETVPYDMIYSSYAIHHLSEEKKQALLLSCAEKLKADGVLVIIDVFRQVNQDREAYLKDYLDWINTSCPALSQPEKELIINHITTYDFPSKFDDFEKYLHVNRFKITHQLTNDPHHKMLMMQIIN